MKTSLTSAMQDEARARVVTAKLVSRMQVQQSATAPRICNDRSCLMCAATRQALDEGYQSTLIATLGVWDN